MADALIDGTRRTGLVTAVPERLSSHMRVLTNGSRSKPSANPSAELVY